MTTRTARTAWRRLATGVAVAALAVAVPAATAAPDGHRIPVGGAPQQSALDPGTATLYVVNGDDATVSVIDAAACNARHLAGCGGVVATVPVGGYPAGVGIDRRTDTVYVSDIEGGRLLVLDGRRCRAGRTDDCAVQARVQVGSAPVGVAVDQTTDTVYVGSLDDHVAVVDGRHCTGADPAGCGVAPAVIAVGPGPALPTVEERSHTLYVPNQGVHADLTGTTLSVVDISRCNAATPSGCGATPALVDVGDGPVAALSDPATETVYVTNYFDNTVSVVDARHCTGRDHAGCGQAATTLPVGNAPSSGLTLDARTRTVYVTDQGANALSAIDTHRCSARHPAGCAQAPPTVHTGDVPVWVTFDAASGTLYVADLIGDDVTVLRARACSAASHRTCRRLARSSPTGGARDLAVDAATHTLYVTQPATNTLALVDTRSCRAHAPAACGAPVATAPLGAFPVGLAVDHARHTLYVDNRADATVWALDTATCNVDDHAGCAPLGAPIPVGAGSAELALNELTHTLYVANGDDDTVSVLDVRQCSAERHGSCAQSAPTVAVGDNPRRVAVDPGTNSVYVSNYGVDEPGTTVSVLDGARCSAAISSGCGRPPATVTVGLAPQGMVVDAATHTLYVADQAFNDAPGRVSVVDLAHCRGGDVGGCDQPAVSVATAIGPRALALDPRTHTLYTANLGDASSSIVNVARCSALEQAGCGQQPRSVAVGDSPTDVVFDAATGTVYVANSELTPPAASERGTVSLYAAR